MKTSVHLWLCIAILFFYRPSQGQEKTEKAKRAAVALYELGERAYLKGDYHEALDFLNHCVVADAGYYDAYTSRAAVKERLQDWSGAITDYSIYLDKFPDNREILFSRGLARYQADLFEQAFEDFNLLSRLPSDVETQTIFYRQSPSGGTDQIMTAQDNKRDYVLGYLGLTAYKMNRFDEAILFLDSAIYLNPHEADYYVHRGLVREELKLFEEAGSDYRKALSLESEHSIAHHNLGVLHRKNNNLSDAEDQLNMAIESSPNLSYPYLERAYHRQEKGDLAGALTDYNRAIKLDPKNPDSWLNRGMLKERMKDLDGAQKDFTQAIEVKGNFEKAWFCRGNVLSKMNKLKEAEEDYTVAILYHPTYAHAYHNRAIVRHRLGNLNEACEDVRRAELYGIKTNGNLKRRVCIEQ